MTTTDAAAATEPQTPTDVDTIARWIAAGSDETKDSHGRDLLARLTAALGHREAEKLWDNALGQMQHDRATAYALADLDGALRASVSAIDKVFKALDKLASNAIYHPDYVGAGAAQDLRTLLEHAHLDLRCAIALNPEKPAPALAEAP